MVSGAEIKKPQLSQSRWERFGGELLVTDKFEITDGHPSGYV